MGLWQRLFGQQRGDADQNPAATRLAEPEPRPQKTEPSLPDWSVIPSKMARLGDNFGQLDDRTIQALLFRIQHDQEGSLAFDAEKVYAGANAGRSRMDIQMIERLLRQRGVVITFLHDRHGEGFGKACYVADADEICIAWATFSNYVFVGVKPVRA